MNSYISAQITRKLRDNGQSVNHKRIERIMREKNICAKTQWKYKTTTVPTDEVWIYLPGVMDLCRHKMVGVAINSLMTKQFVIDTRQDAIKFCVKFMCRYRC